MSTPGALNISMSGVFSLLLSRALRRACTFVIVIFPRGSSVTVLGAKVIQVRMGIVLHVIHGAPIDGRSRTWKQVTQFLQRLLTNPAVLGELDVDLQVQITSRVTALMRHTLPSNLENLAWAQDGTGFLRVGDFNAAAVEVLDDNTGEPAEGFGEGDFDGGEEV